MSSVLRGPIGWKGSIDQAGYRTYHVDFSVEVSTPREGPATVMRTPGLYLPGAPYFLDLDIDPWVWATPEMSAEPVINEKEPVTEWTVSQTFTNKPPDRNNVSDGNPGNNNGQHPEDPSLELAKISGSFSKFQEEAVSDRFGKPITNSSFEQLRGPQVEFDSSRPGIKIEQNMYNPNVPLLVAFRDLVNDRPLWGLPKRCIKLSHISFDRKYYKYYYAYFVRNLEFEIRYEGFDRDILDEGNRVLHGHWDRATGLWVLDNIAGAAPDPRNPAHYDRATDRHGNQCRVILDGAGKPFSLEPNIMDCSACPTGAPKMWKVHGLRVPMMIENSGGCNWRYVENPAQGTLSFTGGALDSGVWKFTRDTFVSGIVLSEEWQASQSEWQCFGPNTMVKTRGNSTTARTISLTVKQAGNIHIEKYGEGNFLLLGIPPVL